LSLFVFYSCIDWCKFNSEYCEPFLYRLWYMLKT